MKEFWIITLTIIILLIGYVSFLLWIDIKSLERWIFYIPALLIIMFPSAKFWYEYYKNLFK